MSKKFIIIFIFVVSFFSYGFGQADMVLDMELTYKKGVLDFTNHGLPVIRNGEVYQPTPVDLKVGDIFIDVDGNAKKVTSVTEENNTIIINTVKAEFFEFVEDYNVTDWQINFEPGTGPLGSRNTGNTKGTIGLSETLYSSKHGSLISHKGAVIGK